MFAFTFSFTFLFCLYCVTLRLLFCFSSSLTILTAPISLMHHSLGLPKNRLFNVLSSALCVGARNLHGFGLSHQVFDEMRLRDVISWTAAISLLIRSNKGNRAVELFKSMLRQGPRPNYVTILCVVRALGAMGLELLDNGIHAFVIKCGFEAETSICTVLIGLYSSLHEIESARQLFYQAKTKDLILWSAMVSALSKNGQFLEALGTLSEMQSFGVMPNDVSIMSVLSACADLGALSKGKEIHGFAVKREFYLKTNLQNALVDMYAKCNMLDIAVVVFDRIQGKDVISWKIIICSCTEYGRPREALLFFSSMISSYVRPDETNMRNVLDACPQAEDLRFGLGLHCYIVKSGLSNSISVGTALLKMYADFDEVGNARQLFDGLIHKDFIAWSAMVSVYSHSSHPCFALDMLKQMQLVNEEANEVTFVSLLRACLSIGIQGYSKSIHGHVIRIRYSSNKYITSALIDFYCKIGKLRQGKALFDELQNKDLVCWSSMINGYGINGKGEEAIKTFLDMLEHGLKPNEIIFVSLLSSCSHCGLVDEGWEWFYSMEEKYGVCPDLTHFSCVADMLSRQGQVKEALEFINKMPMEPDVNIWGALLAGCKHNDIEVAEIAVGRLIRLDPRNSSYYVALSNLYAELGRWSDVERIRELVGDMGLKKVVGYSMC